MPDQEKWIEGFVAECAELGIPKEGAAVLLKVAAQLAMCEDENFVAGFTAEMEKNAGLTTALLKSPAWLAAPGAILGYLGLQQLVDAFRQNWRRSPEESALLGQMQGAMSHPDPSRLVEQMDIMRRTAHRMRSPVGGSYSDPLLGGGREFAYNPRY